MLKKLEDLRQQARIAAGIIDRKVYSGPWTVQIDLTNRCNNDCIACWCNSPLLGDKGMPSGIRDATLPYERLVTIVDELSALGVRSIYFTGGGEPFMHPRILDLISYIKGKGIHLDMSTNFTLVDRATAEELVRLELDHMNLSLWAGSREVYAKQHPNKSEETFDRMTEVIRHINELKRRRGQTVPGLGMYNVINVHNYQDIHNMLEFAFRHRMDHVHFTHVDTVPDRTEVLALDRARLEELAAMAREVPRLTGELGARFGHRLHLIGFETFLRRTLSSGAPEANYDTDLLAVMPSCYAGWSFARILANGEINSCLKSFKIPVGNIHEDSFTRIWFGERQAEFRDHTIDYDPGDPYFLNMGNDMATDGQGCQKCCDNLGLNLDIQGRLDKLNAVTKGALKILRFL
ncbi:MAG: radical SAM protein [bacterium]|nr:MAG: radical SAM protein [bacterium]